jgi:hypothetical protein
LGLGQARPHTALRGLQGHKSPSLMNRFPSLMALRLLSCGGVLDERHTLCAVLGNLLLLLLLLL